MELRKMVMDDPSLASASLGPGIEISPEDIRGDFYNLMQVSLFEVAWFSHRHGQLTEDYFKTWADYMVTVAQRPAFRDMWQIDRTKILHDRFREYMDIVLASAERNDQS